MVYQGPCQLQEKYDLMTSQILRVLLQNLLCKTKIKIDVQVKEETTHESTCYLEMSFLCLYSQGKSKHEDDQEKRNQCISNIQCLYPFQTCCKYQQKQICLEKSPYFPLQCEEICIHTASPIILFACYLEGIQSLNKKGPKIFQSESCDNILLYFVAFFP